MIFTSNKFTKEYNEWELEVNIDTGTVYDYWIGKNEHEIKWMNNNKEMEIRVPFEQLLKEQIHK